MSKYRLSGIDTPFGGISWERETTAKERLKYLFTFLESKRILVNPTSMEKLEWCIKSVLEIKTVLIDITKDIEFDKEDIKNIKDLISSCNNYLDSVSNLDLPFIIYKDNDKWENLSFDSAMKRFRKNFKEVINIWELKYNLKFEKEIPKKY